MKKVKWWLVALGLVGVARVSAQHSVVINGDLHVVALSPKVYQYTAWADMGSWGRIGSNGMVVVDRGEAFLVDTPVDEAQTERLATWIADSLGACLVGFVPGHWHQDCVGGMAWLERQGVKTYAYQLTDSLLVKAGKPRPVATFGPVGRFRVGSTAIECRFLGGGHAWDNIVVWLPKERILFGGCMVKEVAAQGVGNTEDAAPLEVWSQTIQQVQKQYPNAQVVVPGHGAPGGVELLEHTKKILNQHKP